ncbi:NgoMIV family type II restriction endonuclease [Bacillus sp. T33-2]|uniref:NgoMIV family type II restriction endonuclease n=1 Tax=Bacillus sp. T33-2 TaxID=2054168 RepID=UPI000C75D072|nr:NgoMIV family type II restriction endonuclease [Bacillus sp. T33-2]PLR98237.1 restriction endonuclease [Bacillus sp. T33-2]
MTNKPKRSELELERKRYHAELLNSVLTINSDGVPSNADKGNRLSVLIAAGIADLLESSTGERLAGQTSGSKFETINTEFIINTFKMMGHIRPGEWEVRKIGNNSRMGIAEFEQYSHLADLTVIAKENPVLAAAIGRDYTITPDTIISRKPLTDAEINTYSQIVDSSIAKYTPLREVNNQHPILHASISSKWTIRSDRSQNSRSEALNLIRNRKGKLPHIVVITGEPLPSRLASIALGTGDIDCVYHFALHELMQAVANCGALDALEMLNIMINGKRLKDISDLPLDLSI